MKETIIVKSSLLKELSRYHIRTWADIIYRNALLYPDREAFVFGAKRITFSEFNTRVNKLIHSLQRRECRNNDVIGILSWNCLEFAEVYGAAMKGGFIVSPFNPRLKESELEYIINNSLANTLFVGPELVDTVNSIRPRLPKVKNFISFEGVVPGMTAYEDLLESASGNEPDVFVAEDTPVCIIYTSGTTGVPRGALYTQKRFIEESRTLSLDMRLQSGHRRIQITPLFHIAGNSHFRATLYTGGCNIICKFFDAAETLQLLQKEKATHIDIVPTHLVAMLNLPDLQKYDISSLKMIFYGGSPMPLEIIKKGMQVFGPVFSQGYGQSESGPAICHLTEEDHRELFQTEYGQLRLGSAGKPYIGVQVRIVDEKGEDVPAETVGEIIVRSDHIMQEYFHNPEATSETVIDNWLHTGDLGRYDEGGYIFITDRKKDMIITGGENVYSREVEEILYRHPAILEAAVIGVPDPYWVERVHAVITLKQGQITTVEEIIAFCKKQIAGYKVPKSVEFVEELPKNSSGKMMKRELRDKYQTKHPGTSTNSGS
ncbi:MAG: long-chain-fatty-acid--CoA ligase [Dehalococcoidales bacterium]|nr:long-chain-fatty-acid--CoA ligase [Dehalococcoidales bacterium]